MNGRSDASTSTDDVLKGQPLCLFYFTHPFGVVSPEPPLVTVPPSHLARCFPNTPFSPSTPEYCSDSTPFDELFRRDSFSSLLSSSLWLSSGSGERRVLPCHRLPPLRLPSPPPVPTPPKALAPAPPDRFFLPPIHLSLGAPDTNREWFRDATKRPKLSGVRRMLTGLVRRNIEGGARRRRRRASPGVGRASPTLRRASPALREALRVLRDAWPSPAPLRLRFRGSSDERSTGASEGDTSGDIVNNTLRDTTTESQGQTQGMWWGGASPGLLRRRYSVPETIMRKYRLAQQRSEWEEESARESAPACGRCSGECGAGAGGDMRKSALLRVWGRAEPSRCRCSATRSLDGSRCELRLSSRCLTPKRPRLDALPRSPDPTLRLTSSAYSIKSTKSSETALFSTDTSSNCRQKRLPYPINTFSAEYSFNEPAEPTSMPTAKEIAIRTSDILELSSNGSHIDGRISEDTFNAENEDCNVIPYNRPLSIDTQQYEILEIVVSETLNVQSNGNLNNEVVSSPVRNTTIKSKKIPSMNIDEYVSNILVESLNSLTDQLESINASMGYEQKLNIVEKEIKVKLQNTGVNTIVHLSPTSNNQIIFGNEELCHKDRTLESDNDVRNESIIHIRDSALSIESNNNLTSAESLRDNNGNGAQLEQDSRNLTVPSNDFVNKAILQQIQKLFKDDVQKNTEKTSHTESAKVNNDSKKNIDTYTNPETTNPSNSITTNNSTTVETLGGVGATNYYEDIEENILIPRLSALPHSDSMEGNTSSSEDTDMLGSECASLVDSLDDPNSPRCAHLRRSRGSAHRADLVRSAIDVLDLLPENTRSSSHSPKEKGESFFVRIKDGDCDCEKENIIVADHMPETIKQRLFRRHRKREQRMECVKRTKVKQLRRDVRNKQNEDYKIRKEVEKECLAIVNVLIDDVILKIVQNEYKNLKIKQKSNNIYATKSDENLNRKPNKKEKQLFQSNKSRMIHSQSCSEYIDKKLQKQDQDQPVKSSINLPPTIVETKPKRIYQKSEIYDGNKCVEILEILEYVNTSQNSSDTTNSDENHNNFIFKSKKSRIPIPVYERIQRLPKSGTQKIYKNSCSRSHSPQTRERNKKTKRLLASMLFDAFAGDSGPLKDMSHRRPIPSEPRARSNSLRFHNPFDIIPEEKSGLSMESTGEESAGRRASAPTLAEHVSNNLNEKLNTQEREPTPKMPIKYLKSAGTSPMPEPQQPRRHVATATSPSRKSAATSPRRPTPAAGFEKRKSVTTQCDDDTVKTVKSDPELNNVRKIKSHNCLNNHTKETQKQTRPTCEREKFKGPTQGVGRNVASEESSSSGESDAALLSPGWLATRRRRRGPSTRLGEWAVTVAGSCAAALPNDVEMRLRFPEPRPSHRNSHPESPPRNSTRRISESCTMGSERARRGSERLTLTVKKEASDSSVVASKSMKKSRDLLPELQETFRASRTDTRSSLKTRRGCSLHCWLPEEDSANIRARGDSSGSLCVSGRGIVPERKPLRAPSLRTRRYPSDFRY